MRSSPGDGYVLDTCALMDLSGENEATSFTDDHARRERVFQGLERLIQDGRCRSVAVAKIEVEQQSPIGYKRLSPFGSKFSTSDTPELILELQQVLIYLEPREQRWLSRRRSTREWPDPYMVALARMRGWVMVTSERHRTERAPNNRREQKIPDLCDAAGVDWFHLADLVGFEGL